MDRWGRGKGSSPQASYVRAVVPGVTSDLAPDPVTTASGRAPAARIWSKIWVGSVYLCHSLHTRR